jgi:hypothetical protein
MPRPSHSRLPNGIKCKNLIRSLHGVKGRESSLLCYPESQHWLASLQIVTEKCLAANFCIQEFAFKLPKISFGYSWHTKWPSTPKVVHINIIITSQLCSFLNSFFSPFSYARPTCVLKHRWRKLEDTIFFWSEGKSRNMTWHQKVQTWWPKCFSGYEIVKSFPALDLSNPFLRMTLVSWNHYAHHSVADRIWSRDVNKHTTCPFLKPPDFGHVISTIVFNNYIAIATTY